MAESSPKVAFENLMIATLASLKQASEARHDDEAMAYIDVLNIGLAEARDNGVEFEEPSLIGLDPYQFMPRRPAA